MPAPQELSLPPLAFEEGVVYSVKSSLPTEPKLKTAASGLHPGLPFRIPAQGETQLEMDLFRQQPNKRTKDYQACDESWQHKRGWLK